MKYLISFLILSIPLIGASIYDTNTGQYQRSIDTHKHVPKAGVLVNPDASAIVNVPRKYWKAITVGTQADGYAGSSIVEMSAAEKAAVDAVIATAAAKRRGRATARNAARPKRSEITAIKAANAAATTVADLRVINDTLIQMMENVLHYQRVNIDEDE